MTLSISTRGPSITRFVLLHNGNTTTKRHGEITVFNMMYERQDEGDMKRSVSLKGKLVSYLHAYCLALAYGELIGRFGAQLDTRIA